MTFPQCLRAIDTRYRAGNATEHTYRGDLQQLLKAMTTGINYKSMNKANWAE